MTCTILRCPGEFLTFSFIQNKEGWSSVWWSRSFQAGFLFSRKHKIRLTLNIDFFYWWKVKCLNWVWYVYILAYRYRQRKIIVSVKFLIKIYNFIFLRLVITSVLNFMIYSPGCKIFSRGTNLKFGHKVYKEAYIPNLYRVFSPF